MYIHRNSSDHFSNIASDSSDLTEDESGSTTTGEHWSTKVWRFFNEDTLGKEIVIGIVIVLLVIVGIIVVIRCVRRRYLPSLPSTPKCANSSKFFNSSFRNPSKRGFFKFSDSVVNDGRGKLSKRDLINFTGIESSTKSDEVYDEIPGSPEMNQPSEKKHGYELSPIKVHGGGTLLEMPQKNDVINSFSSSNEYTQDPTILTIKNGQVFEIIEFRELHSSKNNLETDQQTPASFKNEKEPLFILKPLTIDTFSSLDRQKPKRKMKQKSLDYQDNPPKLLEEIKNFYLPMSFGVSASKEELHLRKTVCTDEICEYIHRNTETEAKVPLVKCNVSAKVEDNISELRTFCQENLTNSQDIDERGDITPNHSGTKDGHKSDLQDPMAENRVVDLYS